MRKSWTRRGPPPCGASGGPFGWNPATATDGWGQGEATAKHGGHGRRPRDAAEAASVPQWWLREDLRAFDHIHPNSEGHALISALMCPSLPESWGCACPAPVDVERMEEVPSEVATPIAPPARSVTPSEAHGAERSFPDLPAPESTFAPRP